MEETMRPRVPGTRLRLGIRRICLLLTCCHALAASAEPVGVGSSIQPIVLEDQHGVMRGVDATTRAVFLSRDMDGGAFVREALAEEGAAKLEKVGAVYIADVHRMPGPIRRWIAIPRMRDRSYPVLLDTDGEATASLPSAEGKATWNRLEGLRVVEVRQLGTTAEVVALLGGEAPPGD
jgi:hypothetical protein